MSFVIENNKLKTNDKQIQFEYNIAKAIEINDVIVVLLDVAPMDKADNNVYGVIDGAIAWQVQNYAEVDPNYDHQLYTLMKAYEECEILITDFSSCRFIVNPQNGKIVGRESPTQW